MTSSVSFIHTSIFAFIVAAFAGCTDRPPQEPEPRTVNIAPASSASVATVEAAPTDAGAPPAETTTPPSDGGVFSRQSPEGGMCGGLIGRMCQPGLRCVMRGVAHPDQAGRCERILLR